MPPFFSGQIFFLKVSWLAVRDKFKSHTFLSLKSKKKRERGLLPSRIDKKDEKNNTECCFWIKHVYISCRRPLPTYLFCVKYHVKKDLCNGIKV